MLKICNLGGLRMPVLGSGLRLSISLSVPLLREANLGALGHCKKNEQ